MIDKFLRALLAVVLACSLAACEQLTKQNEITTKSSPESADTAVKTTTIEPEKDAHWDYEEDGPAKWGSLSKKYAICGEGKGQSPIDIENASTSELPEIETNFPSAELKIIHHAHKADVENTGHTIQVDYSEGDTLKMDGIDYALWQYHFHAPSEHTVNGKHTAMEMHMVHRTADGKNLAVVGVLIEPGTQTNSAFDPIWANLPNKKSEKNHLENVEVDVNRLLPESKATYRYDGSLTTPPCSEKVKWVIFSNPIQLSAAQIGKFTELIKENNRPTQPLNGRIVKADRIEEMDSN